MHKKYVLLSLIFLLFSILSCKSVQNKNEANVQAIENSLLWKIEGKGLHKASYLFGTIHIIKSEEFFLPNGFNEAFNKSNNIVFEIDMSMLDDMEEVMSLLPKVMMKDDLSLRDLISEDEYEKVNRFFTEAGLPLFFLEKIKPMFLTMFADPEVKPGILENGEYKSYELEFHSMAENQNKKVSGLESIDYQISILDSIPYKEQARMLLESIDNQAQDTSSFDLLVKQYKEQDINTLFNSIKKDDISKYEKILLNDRNENWIPVMEEMMKQEASFFAVGAGHLGGEKGVINLLRKAGYKVIPVFK